MSVNQGIGTSVEGEGAYDVFYQGRPLKGGEGCHHRGHDAISK